MLDNKRHSKLLLKLSQGKISEKERWELERASLDDAFLADALEGYYNNMDNHNVPRLTNLAENNKKAKEVNLVRKWMAIAASLFILLTISIWTFNRVDLSDDIKPISEIAEQPELHDSKARNNRTLVSENLSEEVPSKDIDHTENESDQSILQNIKTKKSKKNEI